MTKKFLAIFLAISMALSFSACGGNKNSSDSSTAEVTTTTTSKTNTADSDEKDMQTESTSEQQSTTEITDDYYLSYVLGKMVVDGKETVYLTDERDMDNWQVPVKDAAAGEGNDFARIRFIGIDWKADGTIEQVNMCDFLTANTFGALVNPGSSGKLSVNSYGAEAGGVPDHSEWDITVNGTEVVLTSDNGTVYYFYEDHFDEQ